VISPSEIRKLCGAAWDEYTAREPVSRLWRRDHTLWKPDPREISNRLGWLDLPTSMWNKADDLMRFAKEVVSQGFTDVVLLGMGGSSLSAVVIDAVFPPNDAFPKLHVLDSTIPAAVAGVARRTSPADTLFLVSSKSGGTAEVMALYRYFSHLVREAKGDKAGENFVAITDEGSSLDTLASQNGFRRIFRNPSDVGGRYSVLSYFGLVPAALRGVDIGEFLARGREMARLCGVDLPISENPGAWLGFVMGGLSRAGRDKLTILTSPRLSTFGLWAEQLVAESTGKEGRGIIPIAEESVADPSVYGKDRLFACLGMRGDDNGVEDFAKVCHEAGLPLVKSLLKDEYDLASEFFKWEFAVALAGMFLQINPFDQPNVEESKVKAKQMLRDVEQGGALPALESVGRFEDLLEWADERDYMAFMAFVEQTPELDAAFAELREALLGKRRMATTLGYGPRFLHSTGQLHKGGADNSLFVQITSDPEKDLPIPGVPYSFGTLAQAQAMGDFEALRARNRRAVRIHVAKGESVVERIRALAGGIQG
jgi:glucose-6-phosphate isomerase/transaldolase/glucose-6-phosphate isomerase